MYQKCPSFIPQNDPYNVANQIAKHEDLENQKSFQVFVNAIRSESTRKYYVRDLYHFLEFTKVSDFDSMANLSVDKIQDYLEAYVLKLRSKKVGSIRTRISGPELFFDMNKKLYHKKVLHKLFPSNDKRLAGDKPFTNEDIQAMLKATVKLRTKALIHFIASTGIRPGAISDPPLQMKHLQKISDNCYAVRVYDESREGYWAFLTPESVKALNHYLDSRKMNGEKITEESYLFATYNMRTKRNDYLSNQDLSSILKRLIRKAGIKREKITSKHYDKAQSYGFRKRFNTILKINNDVNSNIAEKLMAHKRGLDGRYLVPTIDECFNEFRKAIAELTIDNMERDKLKITKQEEQISSLQITQEEKMKNMEERLNSLSDSQFAMVSAIQEMAKTDKKTMKKFISIYEKDLETITDPKTIADLDNS